MVYIGNSWENQTKIEVHMGKHHDTNNGNGNNSNINNKHETSTNSYGSNRFNINIY